MVRVRYNGKILKKTTVFTYKNQVSPNNNNNNETFFRGKHLISLDNLHMALRKKKRNNQLRSYDS